MDTVTTDRSFQKISPAHYVDTTAVTLNRFMNKGKIIEQGTKEDIILNLAKELNVSIDKAMRIYYNSNLARQINEGKYGIDNLDPKNLALDLINNESILFDC